MSKRLTLLLIAVLAVLSLILVTVAPTSALVKPSVPEDFSIRVDIVQGYAPFIVITIKNQAFTPYNDTGGNLIRLYYDIRVKRHSANSWVSLAEGIRSSDSENTSWAESVPSQYDGEDSGVKILSDALSGGKVDFQVRACIGYKYHVVVAYPGNLVDEWVFTGRSSDWSGTRTLSIDEDLTRTPSPAPTPTPTPTSTPYVEPQPTIQELILGIAFSVAIISAGLGLLIYSIKRK